MTERKRYITDITHAPTLATLIEEAFQAQSAQYGVRLVGIEEDANEHSDFWQMVARHLLEKLV